MLFSFINKDKTNIRLLLTGFEEMYFLFFLIIKNKGHQFPNIIFDTFLKILIPCYVLDSLVYNFIPNATKK